MTDKKALKVKKIRDRISEREIEELKEEGMKFKKNGEEQYKKTMLENNKGNDLFIFDEARRDLIEKVIELINNKKGYSICTEYWNETDVYRRVIIAKLRKELK